MFFNKPLLLDISKDSTTHLLESVKSVEKVYRTDISGTWLYSVTALNAPVKIFTRVRYSEGNKKETFKEFMKKFPVFTEEDDHYTLNVTTALLDLDFVHVITKYGIDIEKEYFLHIEIGDLDNGTAEIYLAFCNCPDEGAANFIKKISKAVLKLIK